MTFLKNISHSFFHLFFPHVCAGCSNDVISRESFLCFRCLDNLPETNYHLYAGNPIEKKFWGRLPLQNATAQFYFSQGNLVQELMHQLKYKGNKDLGQQMGRLMGTQLKNSGRFDAIQALLPVPLFPSRERRRGYNQSAVICNGIAEIMKLPVLKDVVVRTHYTDTQTTKNRIERWENIEGRFELRKPKAIAGKHVLLVDDVITTGATLEACGSELTQAGCASINIATMCCTAFN